MRKRLRERYPGLNSATVGLSGGAEVTYFYLGKGKGVPRVYGEPFTPEFDANYERACAQRKTPVLTETLPWLIDEFEASPEWQKLAQRTRYSLKRWHDFIKLRFPDFPLSAFADRRSLLLFKKVRDEINEKGVLKPGGDRRRLPNPKRQRAKHPPGPPKPSAHEADKFWFACSGLVTWGRKWPYLDLPFNPFQEYEPLYEGGNRADKVWSWEQEFEFISQTPWQMQLLYLLAAYTGLRRTDLWRLTWRCYDGKYIKLQTSKRVGKEKRPPRVNIPVHSVLKRFLDRVKVFQKPELDDPIVLTTENLPYASADSMGGAFAWFRDLDTTIRDRTLHDLRGTAVTRLASAGCTEIEIASITRHKLAKVRSILEANYLNLEQIEIAEHAMAKLERYVTTIPFASEPASARYEPWKGKRVRAQQRQSPSRAAS
jgi:integrase